MEWNGNLFSDYRFFFWIPKFQIFQKFRNSCIPLFEMYRKGRKKDDVAFPKNRNLKVDASFEFFKKGGHLYLLKQYCFLKNLFRNLNSIKVVLLT
jgi:hypothetical protein